MKKLIESFLSSLMIVLIICSYSDPCKDLEGQCGDFGACDEGICVSETN